MITDTNIPLAVRQHWASIPNCVDALYCTFQRRQFPWDLREEKMDAMGQLGNDNAAAGCAATWLMGRRDDDMGRVRQWKYISWRVTGNVDKTSGFPPADFCMEKYYHFWDYPDGEKTIAKNKIRCAYGEILDEPKNIAMLSFVDKLKLKLFT